MLQHPGANLRQVLTAEVAPGPPCTGLATTTPSSDTHTSPCLTHTYSHKQQPKYFIFSLLHTQPAQRLLSCSSVHPTTRKSSNSRFAGDLEAPTSCPPTLGEVLDQALAWQCARGGLWLSGQHLSNRIGRSMRGPHAVCRLLLRPHCHA